MLKKVLNDLGLDPQNCVGYCFDGAANMRGKNRGVASRLKSICPKAVYVHCHGHRLNLAIQGCLTSVAPLKNCLGVIQSLYCFIEASPKRHAVYCNIEVEGSESSFVRTLKSQGDTRWACHWEAVKAVIDEFKRILLCLLKLYEDDDPRTSSDARALLTALADFEFLLCLCILKVILSSINSLSRYLQGKNVDVSSAQRNANLTLGVLKDCRSDASFELVWEQARVLEKECRSILADSQFMFKEANLPRRKPSKRLQALCGESAGEGDVISDVKLYQKVNTYFTSLDNVVSEMEERFNENDQSILTSMGSIIFDESPSDSCFDRVSEFYSLDKDLLKIDHRMLHHFVKGNKVKISSAPDLYAELKAADALDMIPMMAVALEMFSSIPATSCSAERSFSALRRIKTYVRNRIGQERLTNVAVLNIERIYANDVMKHNIDAVIDSFGRKNEARVKLLF